MSYVYMKALESAPERYDLGMYLLLAGRLERVRRDIVARIEAGARVLDVGCGTGVLAAQLARKGARVTGIDISPSMLAQARQLIIQEGWEDRVVLQELGIVDLDTVFANASFDALVSTLLFSELSDDEIDYSLAECWRVLRPGGQVLIADEVLPESTVGRIATSIFRLPFVVLTFALTRNTTRRVAGLGARIERAGFDLLEVKEYLAGTLKLFVAQRVD